MTNRRVKIKQGVDEDEKRKNRTKSRVRAKVEWPFRILKRVFGYTKVRYRGILKNHHWHLRPRPGQSLPAPQAVVPQGRSVSGDRKTDSRDAKRGRANRIYP